MAFFTGWLGLGTAIAGIGIVEPTDTGYARQAVSLSDLNAAEPCFLTTGPSSFGAAVADWGALTCAALFDAASAGNCIAYWPLDHALTVGAGQSIRTQAGLDPNHGLAVNETSSFLADGQRVFLGGGGIGRILGWNVLVNAGSTFNFML